MSDRIIDTFSVKKTMGERIKKAREAKGYDRPVFCNRLNKSFSQPPLEKYKEMYPDRLKQWEYGVNPVQLEWIPAICEVLSVDVGYLFGEYEECRRQISDVVAITGLSEETVKSVIGSKSIQHVLNLMTSPQMNLSSQEITPLQKFTSSFIQIERAAQFAVVTALKQNDEVDYSDIKIRMDDLSMAIFEFEKTCRSLPDAVFLSEGIADVLDDMRQNLYEKEIQYFLEMQRQKKEAQHGEHQED